MFNQIFTNWSKNVSGIAVLILFLILNIAPAVPTHSQAALLVPQKGISYVTWDKHRFESEYSDKSLAKLVTLGVEYISIIPTHFQEKYNSTKIISTDKTPSKRSLAHVIKKAHSLGLKVMLKPHIDLLDKYDGTYWRADIGFASEKDWKKWFSGYKELMKNYAHLSKRLNIEILCIGTELSFTTQRDNYWRNVIKEIRKIYKGKIIYAANWDNFKKIKFWDELDYIGIDAYFPLSYESKPSLEDLKAGWTKWIQEIESWERNIDIPIVFTEIGYASSPHAASAPWKNGYCGNADVDIQSKCYKAFFQSVWNKAWLGGVYWWKWDTNTRAGGKNNRQFTPQNKPAAKIIETHYKGYEKT